MSDRLMVCYCDEGCPLVKCHGVQYGPTQTPIVLRILRLRTAKGFHGAANFFDDFYDGIILEYDRIC